MKSSYDIGIIGSGVAGAFAALRLAEKHKDAKAILFEFGRPPGKRRRQLEGWFGCFPTGDGRIYTEDVNKVGDLADGRRVKSISRWFFNRLSEVNPAKVIKSKQPSVTLQKKIKSLGFDLTVHNYQQWYPDCIHQLSRMTADVVEGAGNIEFSFDNEVYGFMRRGRFFQVFTSDGDFKCERLIVCAGRSGWRWVNDLYRKLGILVSDDIAYYGVRAELPAQYLKEYHKSHCSLEREDLLIGPMSWGGTIIQEDHADLTIAAFRANEDRWKTDKVLFSIMGKREVEDGEGLKQTERLGKLAFLLSGDRVGRERIKSFMKGEDQLSLIPEYKWLIPVFEEISDLFPNLISRGYFHSPDINTMLSPIALGSNLESEVKGLFVAGESAGIRGIAAAGISGGVAAEGAAQ
jgi:uncharacterized FAD-dependent dehydrogenase